MGNVTADKTMTREDILGVIKDLAGSQGFYGRLYQRLMSIKEYDEPLYDSIMTRWENQKFKEPVDFVMFIEC